MKDELRSDGSALPWIDAVAFVRRAVAMARGDFASAAALHGWVFFDRGLLDAAAALQDLTGEQVLVELARSHRYHRRVFLTPPWQELYATDSERRHDFTTALAEYSRLLRVYPSLGYELVVLPRVGVVERADSSSPR